MLNTAPNSQNTYVIEVISDLNSILQVSNETEIEFSSRFNTTKYRRGNVFYNVFKYSDNMTLYVDGLLLHIGKVLSKYR